MTPAQEYISLYKKMADLCEQQSWGDPFSYARSKEILATILLGHTLPGPNVFAGALITKKIGIYPEHFYNRFEDGRLVESWKLSGKDVLSILLPKFETKYPTALSKKDPRLSANITWREIQKYGKQVI